MLGHALLLIPLLKTLLLRITLLLVPLRVSLLHLLLMHAPHLLEVGLLHVPVRLLAVLRVLLLPLAVLLAGDRLLAAVPGITGVPRLALGAVAPTQIGH
ncbi:hypothetical protein [Kitasatospora cathayae]|uniref:Secreted protein n=1 Tax=Kitasatospora cathayae TaxID=3004092 RepID=A0ABY7QB25_9ACTN|nr:hypothetical protein [Kitasatospora sp. HUAS 3-15]WBP89885.1 hypothetical protein O1G21_31285 [Kitasatospora sp. HUAS 3-15]